MKKLDLINKKFEKLTVISENGKNKQGTYRWLCQCDCGRKVIVLGPSLKRGHTKSCGCYTAERIGNLNRKSPGTSAKNKIFANYKKGAKLRNLEFKLSFDEVINLSQKNCYYCGILPSNSTATINPNGAFQINYNGIDRMDNTKGYTVENCVACCKQCNYAKFYSTHDEFVNYLHRIADFYACYHPSHI